jgi:hypothetical protein
MSAVPQELRERFVIELLEQGLSNTKINQRTQKRYGKGNGVNRDRIAEIRKSRPPVIKFIPEEPEAALGSGPGTGPELPATLAPTLHRLQTAHLTETGTPQTDPAFVESLTRRVAPIVRNGPEAPRIAKIKNVGNPFKLIVADTVDRLLVFRAGQKRNYAKQLPKALKAADGGNNEPLVKLVTRAAHAARMQLFSKTARVNPTSVDVTDLDEVMSWACPTPPEADSEVAEKPTEAPAELAVQDANIDPVPAAVADTDVTTPGALTEQVVKDEDGNRSFEMSGNFDSAVDLSSTGTLTTSADDTDLGGGNSRAAAAFTVGEDAQLDARDRKDLGDSSNYKKAPKKATGFANHMARGKGEPTYGEKTLASGGQRPTWSEMKAPPRATMPDAYSDLLLASGFERLARSLDPSSDTHLPVELSRGYFDPNARGAAGGAWVSDRSHPSIVPALTADKGKRPHGGGRRGRLIVSPEKFAASEATRLAEIDAYTKRLLAKLAQDAAKAAAERAKALNIDAREATSWARLVKLAARHGIGEETLLELKQKTGMPVSGLGDLLVSAMK